MVRHMRTKAESWAHGRAPECWQLHDHYHILPQISQESGLGVTTEASNSLAVPQQNSWAPHMCPASQPFLLVCVPSLPNWHLPLCLTRILAHSPMTSRTDQGLTFVPYVTSQMWAGFGVQEIAVRGCQVGEVRGPLKQAVSQLKPIQPADFWGPWEAGCAEAGHGLTDLRSTLPDESSSNLIRSRMLCRLKETSFCCRSQG